MMGDTDGKNFTDQINECGDVRWIEKFQLKNERTAPIGLSSAARSG